MKTRHGLRCVFEDPGSWAGDYETIDSFENVVIEAELLGFGGAVFRKLTSVR